MVLSFAGSSVFVDTFHSPHIPHVATEASTLVGGLCDAHRVDQVEGGLVLVVVVGVLVARAELRGIFVWNGEKQVR